MNTTTSITSKQNERIKFLCKLRDRSKRNRYQQFLIEGFRELSRAIDNQAPLLSVYYNEELFLNDDYTALLQQLLLSPEIETIHVAKDVFEKISCRENSDGLIGLSRFWSTQLSSIALHDNSLVLVAEGIEKAGNLGALMRSAESAGVDAFILCDPVTDIFNPNVVRASQGAIFNLPIAVASAEEVLSFLQKQSVHLFATTPRARTLYFQADFTGPSALLVGAEHSGLSDFWLHQMDIQTLAIPQAGISDSLNVNDAAVIVLYEAIRQRYHHESACLSWQK